MDASRNHAVETVPRPPGGVHRWPGGDVRVPEAGDVQTFRLFGEDRVVCVLFPLSLSQLPFGMNARGGQLTCSAPVRRRGHGYPLASSSVRCIPREGEVVDTAVENRDDILLAAWPCGMEAAREDPALVVFSVGQKDRLEKISAAILPGRVDDTQEVSPDR